MTTKETALRLVWEHYRVDWAGISFKRFMRHEYYLHSMCDIPIQHAKITASKIAEYDKQKGEELLSELNKL